MHDKEDINRQKRQTTEWEEIFANRIYDNELISKICEELLWHLFEQMFLIVMKYNLSFFFSFVVSAVDVLRKFYILQGQKHIIFYSFTDGLLL